MSAPPTTPSEPATRERLVAAMTDALQRRGLHGVGLSEVLQAAQAPKGVLYHHFPGGKNELAVAAIESSVAWLLQGLDRLVQRPGAHPVDALRQWVSTAQQALERSGFEQGCPLATVALESTPGDLQIRAALAAGFAALRERLAALLAQAGAAPERAASLATLVVAAYEGALMQARVAGTGAPLQQTADVLLAMLAAELSPAPGA